MVTIEEKELFEKSCNKIVQQDRERLGIGTLSEKTVHAVLKNYLLPKEQYHEQKCEGYVADILYEGEIIEIQTANFNSLRRKLDAFLPKYDVTICYPIPALKWLLWIDEETGEITKKRKSPKCGSIYQVFYELYKIKMYLKDPHLHLRLLLIDVEEYRLLNGWSNNKKKGSTRFDRIPVGIAEDIAINAIEEYTIFIPLGLPVPFTSEDYQKATKLTRKNAQTALNVLSSLDIVIRVGKRKNSILYERKAQK